ncbi:DUF6622 family protein [Methylocapsa sp. S129]|uniref:DUF6622 family protein n=1 Tax=Methylocapsa sp. S129 TaxID=1641869 RepID=UPI00131A70EB|nr:DUF6622 family protein [Methylocapsa sp. S129]
MSHIPAYVYVLFLALLWMGVARCYPRTIRVERLLILPALMVVLGVRGFFGLFPAPVLADLAAALAGGAIGLAIGWRHAGRWAIGIDRSAQTIATPGDVMMLAIILGAFVFEFVLHYGVESHAGWTEVLPIELLAAALSAWFAGMSIGRNGNLALRYWSAAPEPVGENMRVR